MTYTRSGFSGKYIACPKCRSEGKDSTGNHLSLFKDGKAGWCARFHGLVLLNEEDDTRPMKNFESKPKDASLTIAIAKSYPILEYTPRSISKETMEFFEVRTELSESDASPYAHWYPYFGEDGSITGYKTRILPKDFSRGVTGKITSLFGQNKVNGDNFLIVVEGEADALAGRDMMISLKGKAYNIVSLPNGANEEGTIDKVTRSQFEWLAKFKKIVLCLDNDKPGKATANSLADYLCSHTDVRIAELPLKDTASMWEAGRAEEWGKAINAAKRYTSSAIITASEIGLDELRKPLKEGHYFSFLPKTCKKVNGFRTGEITTIIAPPNVGKSSLMRQMMYDTLLNTDEHVGAFFLEETKRKTVQSVLAYHSGVPLNKYRANPSVASVKMEEDAQNNLLPRLHVFEHREPTITDDFLERKIEYLVKAVGCRHIYLDHLSFLISGRDGGNERKEIDMLMTRLARSVEVLDYALFIVSHIKRKHDRPKRKDESYPYWEVVDLDDARGSGGIEQLSHRMIGLDKQVLDPEGDNTRGLIRTRVLRDREWGFIGIGDYLTMDQSGRFIPFEHEY